MKSLIFSLLFVAPLLAAESQSALLPGLLRGPQSSSFGIKREAGVWSMLDPESHFNTNTDYRKVTFDVSNGTMLANLGANGALRTLTAYRDGYRVMTPGWPGVWMAKDCATYGSYAFSIEWDEQKVELAGSFPDDPTPKTQPETKAATKPQPSRVSWDFKTGLLDNLIPVTVLKEPSGRFTATLALYAPISFDGSLRPQGVIYGLWLENTGKKPLKALVHLPKSDGKMRANSSGNWASKDPFEFEVTQADQEPSAATPSRQAKSVSFDAEHGEGEASKTTGQVSVELAPGAGRWIPALLYQPDEAVLAQIRQKDSVQWLKESLSYYRSGLGRLKTPDNLWLGEFFEREWMQALQSLNMRSDGKGGGQFIGSNWGSYEATRLTWMKDCFYSCLPFALHSPELAREMILWFKDYGVRPRGIQFKGGVNHSISLSVSSLMLSGLYYQSTADRKFFQERPELKRFWDQLIDELVASRPDPEIWLFPSAYISDGNCSSDYHTGSNLAVWHAVNGYARILAEAYGDSARAKQMSVLADKIKSDLLTRSAQTGAQGRYLNETARRDGKPDQPFHDGEESETTLAPFYGLMTFDDPLYLSTMRFAMSAENPNYRTEFHGLAWRAASTTSPGCNKALGAWADKEGLWGEHGAFTEIRRITEADGSLWWWTYGFRGKPVYGQPTRAVMGIGKAAWTAGVFTTLFPSKFLGIHYDAPQQKFRWSPLAVTGDFSWQDFPIGHDRFSVSWSKGTATFKNSSSHPVKLEANLPFPANTSKIMLNGNALPKIVPPKGFNQTVFPISQTVAPGAELRFQSQP